MWICPRCGSNNASLNPRCVYCWSKARILIQRIANEDWLDETALDAFNVLCWEFERLIMEPQYELFAKLFQHQLGIMKDMTDLEVQSQWEELSKIAEEAKARMQAIVHHKDEKKKQRVKKEKYPAGFQANVHVDEGNAIQAIKQRQGKVDKREKTIRSLVQSGISRAEAESLVSAGSILARMKDKEANKEAAKINTSVDYNPFAKPSATPVEPEPEPEAPLPLTDDTQTQTEAIESPKPQIYNPFAKG